MKIKFLPANEIYHVFFFQNDSSAQNRDIVKSVESKANILNVSLTHSTAAILHMLNETREKLGSSLLQQNLKREFNVARLSQLVEEQVQSVSSLFSNKVDTLSTSLQSIHQDLSSSIENTTDQQIQSVQVK